MRSVIFLFILFLSVSCLFGQSDLTWGKSQINEQKMHSFSVFPRKAQKQNNASIFTEGRYTFNNIIPGYVRENPRDYSYLCRLELEIEEKLPLGIWFKVGDNYGLPGGNAHVRFRLFNF